MSNFINRVYRRLRGLFMGARLRRYLAGMDENSPLKGIPVQIRGDAYGDPTETFSHYDAFAYWLARKLSTRPDGLRILDVGSRKIQGAMLSAVHDVTSLVLVDCSDHFSAVKYILHDVSDPLPFAAGTFDCFTSTVSLPLIGLGRYGDKLDSNSLSNFVRELDRVMRPDADLFVSLCLGPNFLAFNNGWYFDLETIRRIFSGWTLVEAIADGSSSCKGRQAQTKERFVPLEALPPIPRNDFWVAFFHFRRQGADAAAASPATI